MKVQHPNKTAHWLDLHDGVTVDTDEEGVVDVDDAVGASLLEQGWLRVGAPVKSTQPPAPVPPVEGQE